MKQEQAKNDKAEKKKQAKQKQVSCLESKYRTTCTS